MRRELVVDSVGHLGLDRVAIVGCSQGGDSALAVTAPERVSALVLLCPGVSGYEWPAEPDIDAEFDRAAADGVEAVAALGTRLWAAAGPTPEVVEQLRSAARAWLSADEVERPNPPFFDRLGEVAVPTSIMVGDLDRPALIDCNLRVAERIPGCELGQISGPTICRRFACRTGSWR
jgi:3-oxoadipate enol-lactonase